MNDLKEIPKNQITPQASDADKRSVQQIVMRICSAYKECKEDYCPHIKPHECELPFLQQYSVCMTTGIMSACVEIKDNKIPVQRILTCEHCGQSRIDTVYEEIKSA